MKAGVHQDNRRSIALLEKFRFVFEKNEGEEMIFKLDNTNAVV